MLQRKEKFVFQEHMNGKSIDRDLKTALEAAAQQAGVEIEITSMEPTYVPRTDGDLTIRFCCKNGNIHKIPNLLSQYADVNAFPKSVSAVSDGFLINMKPDEVKLGLA